MQKENVLLIVHYTIPSCIGMFSRPDEDNRTTSLQVGKI